MLLFNPQIYHLEESIMAVNTEQDIATLKSDFKDLRKDFSDLSTAIKELAVDESRLGYEKLKKTTEKVGNEIEERPFMSVGVAMGVGFLIGVILDRSISR